MKRINIINARTLDNENLVDFHIEGDVLVEAFHENQNLDQVIDANGHLVLPGLVNPHTHLDKVNLSDEVKNVSGTVEEARQKMFEYKPSVSKEDIKQRATRAIEESVRFGVVAIRTHVDIDPSIGLRGIQALLEVKEECSDKIDLQIVAFPQEGISESPGTYALMDEALRMGADVVGGHLSIARDYHEHLERVFSLANKYGKPVDIHVDFSIDKDYSRYMTRPDGKQYPENLGVLWMAEEVLRQNLEGRTAASHVCGLDSIPPDVSRNVIDLIRKADIAVIALPPGNLFLQGRSDDHKVRRGVTKVKDLLESGVRVSFGPDNIRDPFNPIGSPDMILNAILTTYACHMASHQDFKEIMRMCTYTAAGILGLPKYGLEKGCYADLVILDQDTVEDVLTFHARPLLVCKHGKITYEQDMLGEKTN